MKYETIFPGITLLKIQMNTDLMTDDLKKNVHQIKAFGLLDNLCRSDKNRKR